MRVKLPKCSEKSKYFDFSEHFGKKQPIHTSKKKINHKCNFCKYYYV